MKREWIAYGSILFGFGLTIVLALPPPFWPKMPSSLVNAGIVLGFGLCAAGVAAAIYGGFSLITPRQARLLFGGLCFLIFLVVSVRFTIGEIRRRPAILAYPRIEAALKGNQDYGPYSLVIFNDTEAPFINMTVRLSDAMDFSPTALDAVAYKQGDVERGVSNLSGVPQIWCGYYQIDLRYRDGPELTEMLQIVRMGGRTRQFIWLTDGKRINIKPDEWTPQPSRQACQP